MGFWFRNNNTASQSMVGFGQSTADPGFGGGTPAGVVYFCVNGGTSTTNIETCGYQIQSFASTGTGDVWVPTPGLTFAAGYYPFWQDDTSTKQVAFRMIGYEQ
jgi:hypothetical protein